MELAFTKMHGLGNDFVVIDAINQPVRLDDQQIRAIADRRFGVGCDQLLLVEPPDHPAVDFRYRIFNADGGEVEQCGNGARCFARFVRDKGLTDKREIPVRTAAGDLLLTVLDDGQVTVDMGKPRLEPADLPLDMPRRRDEYELTANGQVVRFRAVSMGNPHMVILVDDVDTAPVETLGPVLESHRAFPQRVNVGFMQVTGPDHFRLRVYERGAGETLACGTGACAAMVAGRLAGLLDQQATAQLRGGSLSIRWAGEGEPVYMTGPAISVFEGTIGIQDDTQG